MASGPITSWQIEGEKVEVVTDFLFLGSKIIVGGDCSHEIRKWLLLDRKAMTNLDSVLKSRDINLPTKVHIVRAMVLPVVICGCASWTRKKPECWTVVLEKTFESPLESRETKPVNLEGNQPWTFIGRTYAEAEAPIPWPTDAKSWLIWKDPDTGKDLRQEEKGTTQDEMVGWYYQHNAHQFG